MQITEQLPWHGLMIMVATVLTMVLLIVLTLKITQWVTSARDDLRERYASPVWKPAPVDFLALPAWIVLELLCLVAALAYVLITLLLVYQVAKSARDWWHAGNRGSER